LSRPISCRRARMKNGEVCLRISYDKEQSKTLVPLIPNLFIGS
ncbi:adaptor-related protein complex 1, sigma 2 subunit, isoform CRA_c, partial [Mus musculus]